MIDIARLRKDIEGPSEDARFLAFLDLYNSTDPAAGQMLDQVVTLQDPVLKLAFLRFLGHIAEERAVVLISRLLNCDNSIVVDAAERAFDRNHYDGKLACIMPLLNAPHRRAQLVAISHVSQGWMEAVHPLLALLDAADDELTLAILSALRFLPSRVALIPVMKVLEKSQHEEVRFRAVMVLGVIYENFNLRLRNVLLKFLNDPFPRARQAALWALRRRPSRKNIPVLIRLSAEDPEPLVRREALSELKVFPTTPVIHHLLNILVSETNRMVSLRCESVLLDMDHENLIEGLSHIVDKSSGPARRRAILLAADFQRGSNKYYHFLVKGLRSADDDAERVTYIEALGILGDPRASAELMPYLEKSPLVTYVAMAALLKVRDEDWPFLTYLENPNGSLLLKQMVLRYLIRKEHLVEAHQERLEKCLLTFLRGDNINMRYLAAQVLVRISSRVAQAALLDAVQTESDPASLKLLRNSLVEFFTRDPASFVDFLNENRNNVSTFSTLRDMLPYLIWSGIDVVEELPRLFAPDLVAMGDVYIVSCATWIADQVIEGRVKLDNVMRALEGVPVIATVLQQISAQIEKIPNLVLSVAPTLLWRHLKEGSDLERGAVIDLIGISRSKTSIPVLVAVVCNAKMEKFHAQATRALARITGEVS